MAFVYVHIRPNGVDAIQMAGRTLPAYRSYRIFTEAKRKLKLIIAERYPKVTSLVHAIGYPLGKVPVEFLRKHKCVTRQVGKKFVCAVCLINQRNVVKSYWNT